MLKPIALVAAVLLAAPLSTRACDTLDGPAASPGEPHGEAGRVAGERGHE